MVLSDGCLRCYSEQDLLVLEGDPDLVPDDLVRSVAADPHDHWSSEQWRFLYRRFAPRLVGLVRAKQVASGMSLRAFGPSYADLAGWPDEERHATENALSAVLVNALAHWPSYELVELLDGLACAYDNLRPWLARLDTASGDAALGGVIRLACYWATGLLWGDDDWFTWWDNDDQLTAVRDWTMSARIKTQQFSEAHPKCKNARDALIAYDRLDRGEPSPWVYPGYAWTIWERWGLPGQYGWVRPADESSAPHGQLHMPPAAGQTGDTSTRR